MSKKIAWCWIVAGAMLLIAALFLILYNLHQDEAGGRAAGEVLSALREEMSENPLPTEEEATVVLPSENLYAEYEEPTELPAPTDPVLELDGEQYAGIVSIPRLGVELPVLQNWSYPRLQTAPCRYAGAAASGDLIIAAHNYRSHFGNLQSLNSGDQILFTNAAGVQYVYEVVQSELVNGQDVPTMLAASEEGWDLTLFTCTLSGQSRVTVRAVQISPEE